MAKVMYLIFAIMVVLGIYLWFTKDDELLVQKCEDKENKSEQ